MSKLFLKVKLKSLAAESKIIRHEEQKRYGDLRMQLQDHRRQKVREESRNTHLAYGYLNNKSYRQIENQSKTVPDWEDVFRMVSKYGLFPDSSDRQRFKEWTQEGEVV